VTNQNHQSRNAGQAAGRLAAGANEASSTMAKSALDKTKEVGSEAASTITSQVKSLLDDKVNDGADMFGHVARSAHTAAEELDKNAPQLAGLVRGVADRMDSYASDLRDQSIDQLVSAASNYTRRQPAIVFGLAALAGFFALRTIKSTPPKQVEARSSRLPQAGGYYGS
jgi:ElaB/YqjD/DUF883 family membrane-anchored ribosome-binding protein